MCIKIMLKISSDIICSSIHCSPSRNFPILVYFKETQTPEEMWNIGPGEQANSPEAIEKGAGKFIKVDMYMYMHMHMYV